MKKLTQRNRLVIAVIHQPRSSIFNMFDKLLLLLSSEGNTIYYGKANNAIEYFNVLEYYCPNNFNPSDYFLDLLSIDLRTIESKDETINRVNHLTYAWLQHETIKETNDMMNDKPNDDDCSEYILIKTIGTECSLIKTIRNFFLLCWRSWIEQLRNKDIFTI